MAPAQDSIEKSDLRAHVAEREGVNDLPFESAGEFLEALRPTHERWHDPSPAGWIYRGQANATWYLKAKAFRPGEFSKVSIPGDASRWSERAEMLRELLRRFRTGLNSSGVVIPTMAPKIDGNDEIGVTTLAEPYTSAFPLMALAQHHGLPTVLLDRTRFAANAAYFAAVAAATPETKNAGTHLAVWALKDLHDEEELRGVLRFFHPPGGTNPNLRAQAGLFSLLFPGEGDTEISVETYVASAPGTARRTPRPNPVLRRLTLPRSESGKLLRLLAYEGVDGASMFPGADGVVRAMRERALWDKR